MSLLVTSHFGLVTSLLTALHDCWLFSISSHKWGDDVSKNKSIPDFHLAFPFIVWKITVIEVVQNLANYFE